MADTEAPPVFEIPVCAVCGEQMYPEFAVVDEMVVYRCAEHGTRSPTCGASVRAVTSDEGTSYYVTGNEDT